MILSAMARVLQRECVATVTVFVTVGFSHVQYSNCS